LSCEKNSDKKYCGKKSENFRVKKNCQIFSLEKYFFAEKFDFQNFDISERELFSLDRLRIKLILLKELLDILKKAQSSDLIYSQGSKEPN